MDKKTIKIEDAMKLNRHERRKIAKINGIKKIPSYQNIKIKDK